jgi:hypothetical protein
MDVYYRVVEDATHYRGSRVGCDDLDCVAQAGRLLVSCLGNNWTSAAADFGSEQGARRKHIHSGSVSDEQRSTRAKAAPPKGLRRKRPCGDVAARSQPHVGMLPRRALPEGHFRLNKCLAISETGH